MAVQDRAVQDSDRGLEVLVEQKQMKWRGARVGEHEDALDDDDFGSSRERPGARLFNDSLEVSQHPLRVERFHRWSEQGTEEQSYTVQMFRSGLWSLSWWQWALKRLSDNERRTFVVGPIELRVPREFRPVMLLHTNDACTVDTNGAHIEWGSDYESKINRETSFGVA